MTNTAEPARTVFNEARSHWQAVLKADDRRKIMVVALEMEGYGILTPAPHLRVTSVGDGTTSALTAISSLS